MGRAPKGAADDAGWKSVWGRPLGILQAHRFVHGMMEFLFAPEVSLRRLHRGVSEEKLNLPHSPPAKWHRRVQVLLRWCGARVSIPPCRAAALTMCHIAFGVIASSQTLSRRFTRRKIGPPEIPAR